MPVPVSTLASTAERRVTPVWFAGFLLALLAFTALLDWSEATRRLDMLMHDALVRLSQRAAPSEVVIAAIDTDSLSAHGRWPWSRDLQAVVYAELARLAPRAVIVDIVYAEPSARPGADRQLAEVLDTLPLTVLPVLLEPGSGGGGSRPDRESLPVAPLIGVADALGHTVLPIDDDGIVRRVRLKAGFDRAHWSALPLAALEAIDPDRFASASYVTPGRRLITATAAAGTTADASVPGPPRWVEDHEALIPFYGPSEHFARIPVAALMAGTVPRDAVAGRIVLLGLTASGLGDVVPTPVSALERPLAGVELHANVLAALLDGALITPAPPWLGLLVAAVLLPLVLLAYSKAPPHWSLGLALVGALLPVALSAALYAGYNLWFAPVSVALPVLASYLVWSRHRLAFINRFLEAEHARMVREHLPAARDERDNLKLAEFFEQAVRHLPIDGWRFETDDERHAGGQALTVPSRERLPDGWRCHDRVWSRRVDTSDRLMLSLRITAPARAAEILEYIDSLARVRSRIRSPRSGGSVERLQRNATRLSAELDWLRSVKAFSETMLAGSPAGFAVWNPAGELVRHNALVHRLLPQVSERVPLVDFLHAVGQDIARPGVARRFDGLLERGESWQVTGEIGTFELVVDLSATGERLAERLVCASIVDVSAVRSVERARSEMVDFLSHDLRAPLVSALYRIENAPIGMAEDPERAPARNDGFVAVSIRKSLSMMDALLHIARADTLDPTRFHDVLLDDVLDNALDQMQPQAQARGIVMLTAVEGVRAGASIDGSIDGPGDGSGDGSGDDPVWVSGDAVSLERAAINLIGNAIKYSAPGGEIRVTLTGAGQGRAEAELRVSDDGIGIDPEVIGGLFQRFRRDPRTERSHAGIGLGLALVSRVVEQHGGRIEALSEPGRGTDIVLRLPRLAIGDD